MNFSQWECICINNGSTDDSLAVLNRLSRDDLRFRIYDSKETGVSAARNLGMSLAQGHYIQFLDADDYLHDNKLRIHAGFLDEHPDIALVFSNAVYFTENDPEIRTPPPWSIDSITCLSGKGESLVSELLKGNRIVISAPLFRKEATLKSGVMDTSMRYNEDWDFWLRLAKAGMSFHFINSEDCLSFIRRHSISSSTNLNGMYLSELEIYRREAKNPSNGKNVRAIAKKYFFKTWIEIILQKIKGETILLKNLPKWIG